MKEAYLQFLFGNFIRSPKYDKLFGDGWVAAEDLERINQAAFRQAFDDYDFRVIPDSFYPIFLQVFNDVLNGGGILSEGDEFAGIWYRIGPQERANFVKRSLADNPASQRLGALGESGSMAYRRALGRIVAEGLADEEDSVVSESALAEAQPEAPASDRIVLFSDNQIQQVEAPLDDLILQVEKENSVSGEDGLRELVLGQLRSGRELILAGIASLRSLELTLIVGLRLLVDRYQDHAIGAVAGNLLAIIMRELGI